MLLPLEDDRSSSASKADVAYDLLERLEKTETPDNRRWPSSCGRGIGWFGAMAASVLRKPSQMSWGPLFNTRDCQPICFFPLPPLKRMVRLGYVFFTATC